MSCDRQKNQTLRLSKQAMLAAIAFLGVSSGASLSGCSTAAKTTSEVAPMDGSGPRNTSAYEAKINSYSDGDTEYMGLYHNFEYKATLLNSTIRNELLNRQTEIFQWDAEKRQSEVAKSNQEAASETTVFLSFFTPERRNDNLTDVKSIWRLYLDVGGRRYTGKVKKVRTLLVELQSLYPYHTRWNTPYLVTFPVPTTAIETQTAKLTITGPLGTRDVSFAAVQ